MKIRDHIAAYALGVLFTIGSMLLLLDVVTPDTQAIGLAFSPATSCEVVMGDPIAIGATGVFSAWTQLVTATSSARNQMSWSMSLNDGGTAVDFIETQIGLGGIGSEVPIGTLAGTSQNDTLTANSSYTIFSIPSGSRLAVRGRNRVSGAGVTAAFAVSLCR